MRPAAAAWPRRNAATHGASAFGASGLPAGLSIGPSTGVISGPPTVLGSFNVAVSASNTLRTGTAALGIVIVTTVTTLAGTNVSVARAVPEGGAGTITFDHVSGGGETTLAVIEPGTGPATA